MEHPAATRNALFSVPLSPHAALDAAFHLASTQLVPVLLTDSLTLCDVAKWLCGLFVFSVLSRGCFRPHPDLPCFLNNTRHFVVNSIPTDIV